MGSLTPCRVWGAPFRQSSSACRLESIDPVTFLDQGGRVCHSKSNRDAGSICACCPSPNWGSMVKNLATNSWFSRRQHPANADVHSAAGPGPAAVFRAYYHVCRVRSGTRPDSPCRMGIIRPTEGRGTASSSLLEACRRVQPQRGHLCGWPKHNYFRP